MSARNYVEEMCPEPLDSQMETCVEPLDSQVEASHAEPLAAASVAGSCASGAASNTPRAAVPAEPQQEEGLEPLAKRAKHLCTAIEEATACATTIEEAKHLCAVVEEVARVASELNRRHTTAAPCAARPKAFPQPKVTSELQPVEACDEPLDSGGDATPARLGALPKRANSLLLRLRRFALPGEVPFAARAGEA